MTDAMHAHAEKFESQGHLRAPAPPLGAARLISACMVVVLVYSYLSVWTRCGAGFQVGDEGWVLALQQMAGKFDPRYHPGLTWLTEVLGGLWLRLTDSFGLIGARSGWALLNAVAAGSVAFSLTGRFPLRRTCLVVVACTPVICHQQFPILDYTNLPSFFLLLFALCFVGGQNVRSPFVSGSLASVSGTCLGLAIHCRLTVLPCLCLPLLGAWLAGRRADTRIRRSFLIACHAATVMTICLGALVAWRWYGADASGVFDAEYARYRSTRADSIVGGHSLAWLVRVYLHDLLVGLEDASLLCTLVCGLTAAAWWLAIRWPQAAKLAAACFAASTLAFATVAPHVAPGIFNPRYLVAVPFISLSLCAAQLVLLLRTGDRGPVAGASGEPGPSSALVQLLAFAIFIPLVVMAGSNLGFYRMLPGLWLALPLGCLLLPYVTDSMLQRTAIIEAYRRPLVSGLLNFICGTVGAGVVAYAISAGLQFVWPATTNVVGCVATMGHKRLQGVRESSVAGPIFDELLRTLQTKLVPGDLVVAYPHLEMVHYLTETRSLLPAVMFVHTHTENLEALLADCVLREDMPRLIVSRFTKVALDGNATQQKAAVVERFAAQHGYRQTWANTEFQILEQSAE